jgi:long-chain acyl-CoA synthetase
VLNKDAGANSALDVFSQTAARYGERVALQYFDGSVTYSELDRMSDAFAAVLVDGGFARGDRILLFLQNMPHFVIAMLAGWKAGGIVTPVSAMNKQRELDLLLNDCAPRTVILTPELFDDVYAKLPESTHRPKSLFTASPLDFQTRNDPRLFGPDQRVRSAGQKDFLETLRANLGRRVESDPPNRDDIAYLVYTSGTTGVPKGVMILHRNILAGIDVNRQMFDVTDGSRMLGIAPLFHVTGLMSYINLAFAAGGLVILSYRFQPSVMLESVREHGATHVFGGVTAYTAMIHAPDSSPADMSTVRVVGSGGMPQPPALLAPVEKFFGVRVQIGYGMTETSVSTHITPRGADVPVDPTSGALSVGVASPEVAAWVSDDAGNPLPAGEAGEIVVSAPTLTAGYWRKPMETADSYRADGFHTGDIGFRDEAGWFYLIDRKKDMISASGFKVWPREVEDVLYTHPAVREAAVVGIPDSYRGESVRAVVSLKPGVTATVDELRVFCRERMAAYKYPREVIVMDELPKTISGKILRRMLRD